MLLYGEPGVREISVPTTRRIGSGTGWETVFPP
jgi:hypothetical protein